MKKFLLFLAVLLGGISAAYAQIGTLTTKGFWDNNGAYSGDLESTKTAMGVTWHVYGFNNYNNGWDNIRCGSTKGNDPYYPYISTVSAISDVIGQFEIETEYPQPTETKKVTAFKLYIADNKNFTDAAIVTYDKCGEAGTWIIDIPSENQGANKFYKFEFTCPKAAKKNGYLAVNTIKANAPEGDVKNVVISSEIKGVETTVTITCETEGATIYYGFAEDAITNVYSAPFKVTESCTVFAFAKKGDVESRVMSAAVDVPYISFKEAVTKSTDKENVTIVTDCEVLYQNGNKLLLTDGTSNLLVYNCPDQYEVGTKFSKIEGSVTIYKGILFELVDPTFTEGETGATYTVAEVTDLTTLSEDNLFDEIVIKGCNITGKNKDNATLSLGGETLPIYNTFKIDFENGTNYDVTCFVWKNTVGDGELEIAPVRVENGAFVETVKTPTFSPAARELHEGDKVTINCATEGATIYYTIDGTEPTNASKLYSAPFEINFGEEQDRTVKAIAVKDGMLDSEVGEKLYHNFDPTCNVITADNHDGSSKYETHTCTIDGVDYAMNAVHNSTQGIQMNNSSDRFCGLIQTGDNEGLVVKSIEVDFNSNNNNITFTVRASNTPFEAEKEKIISNGVEIGTISNTQKSVEFTRDYNYFAFYPSKNGVVYINSITINYRQPAPIAEAPVLPDNFAANIESDDAALMLPELPKHDDWTPMYQVNDGEAYEADAEGTVHEEELDAATHHTITIWYEHYNGTDKSDPVVYHHVTAPKFESGITGTGDDAVANINFTKIGEGITVYFTLDGTTPTVPTTAPQKVAARAAAKDGVYDITTAADLKGTHAITSESPMVKIHAINSTAKVDIAAMAVHAQTGTSSAVTKAPAVDIPTGIENVVVEGEEAVYYNLQGVRVENPESGVYVRVKGGKAEKVIM